MTSWEFWIHSESAKALGWTLIHSLWEGAALALALALILGLTRASRVRYAAACFTLVGLVASFGATWIRLAPAETYRGTVAHAVLRPVDRALEAGPPANHFEWDGAALLPWLAPMWIAGVLLFQLRCLASWVAAVRLRRRGVCAAPFEWIARLDKLCARLRMSRPVTLLESCFTEVPVVIGHLRPVILMPVGLLAGLPVPQIEAILLHELAHIRRADYLVNLLQTMAEGLLFYHPAAWWISRVIRAERENCCDDLVVATSGDAHEYVTALAALAENRWALRQHALAATGGNLVNRIRRLVSPPEGPRINPAPMLAMGILIATGAAALAAWQSPVPLPIKAPPFLMAPAKPAPQPAAPSKYRRWLVEEVPYIITDQERAEFKQLTSDTDRDRFIEEFWKRRDPTPGTSENEYKNEHYRRIAYANDRFAPPSGLPGWKTDRGRMYIQYGPADEIDSHPAGGAYTRPPEEGGAQTVTYPFEMWRYRYIEAIGTNVILEFVDKEKKGEFRLTMDPSEKEVERRVQREVVEKLRTVEDALKKQVAGIPEEQLRVDIDQISDGLRGRLIRSQVEMKERQERLKQVQQNILAVQERMAEMPNQEQRLRAATQQLIGDMAHTMASAGLAAVRPSSSVFVSGAGTEAAVVVSPNNSILVTVPFEFPAKAHSISASAISSSDGTSVWSIAVIDRSDNASRTLGPAWLPRDFYKLTAVVKDLDSPTEKTYVVNFSVK